MIHGPCEYRDEMYSQGFPNAGYYVLYLGRVSYETIYKKSFIKQIIGVEKCSGKDYIYCK